MEHVFCSKCGTKNHISANNCQSCNAVIYKPGSELPNLKDELLKLKNDYEAKFKVLLDKIEAYEKQPEKVLEEKPEIIENSILPKVAEVEIINPEVPKPEAEKPTIKITAERETEKPAEVEVNPSKSSIEKPKQPVKPKKTLKEKIDAIPVLSVALEELGAPVINLWHYAKKTYNNYKEKNQLPVFFMTLAGIAILLFGFGYLMQLSVSYFGQLSETIKISFGFICSSSVMFWATKLYAKNSKYKEFSSALLGLGIALNYLFIYFLSNLSNSESFFTKPTIGFALIILNTILAIYFALRYETKIVAVLSLVCGAFTPFYLNNESDSPIYFAYLWLLCVSAIYVAYKINWKTLGVISFLTAASIIEVPLFYDIRTFSAPVFTLIFHAFAYLFIWFSLFNGKKITHKLTKPTIILIAGNLSLLLFNLYYLYPGLGYHKTLGYIYLLNALPFFPGLWNFKKQMNKEIKLLIMVIAGTFVAFAIPALFNQYLIGLFWSVEALALIYLGFAFAMPTIRKEGYFLLIIAFAKVLYTLNNLWIFTNSEILFTSGFYNLLALGLIFGLAIYLLLKHTDSLLFFEKKLLNLFSNIVSVWFGVSVIISVLFFTSHWFSIISIIAALILIAIGYLYKLKFTRIIGYIFYVFCTLYSIEYAIVYIPMNWNTTIFSSGLANLFSIGIFLVALQFLLIKVNAFKKNILANKIEKYTKPLNELFSVWFTALFLVTSFYFAGAYAFNLVILPMIGLIYLGHKNKLAVTENLGLGYSVLFFAGIALSVAETESMRFTLQTLPGKIAILELMFVMWGLKPFYNKVLVGSNKNKAMNLVREVFYWIVPLIIISPVKNHIPDFIPVALWVSVLISFILYEYTKCKSLIIELSILAGIASITGLVFDLYYYAIPVSLIVLSIILIKHKGYETALFVKNEFKHIFIGAAYYIGACLFAIAIRILPGVSDALIITSVYYAIIVILRIHIAPIKNNYLVAFWIALGFTVLGIVIKHFENSGIANQLVSFIPLIPMGIILYGKNPIYSNRKKWIALVMIYQTLILTSYSLILDKTWLTIAFTIHAIVILFNSIKQNFKPLTWQSVAFFGLAIMKLFIYDINHFTIQQKVIVFVLIGALLIGAAFLYMKLKVRFEDHSPVVEEEKEASDQSTV